MKARRRFFYRRDCVGDGVSARGIWFLCVKTESVESWGEIQATNGFQWAEIRKHGHFGHNGNENNNNAVLLITPHIFFITCTFFSSINIICSIRQSNNTHGYIKVFIFIRRLFFFDVYIGRVLLFFVTSPESDSLLMNINFESI